jgi:hypothetical protein
MPGTTLSPPPVRTPVNCKNGREVIGQVRFNESQGWERFFNDLKEVMDTVAEVSVAAGEGTLGVNNILISGSLNHDGLTLAFFNATEVGQQGPLTAQDAGVVNSGDATTDGVIENNRTRIAEIEAALQTYGLLA